jgi:lipopolysaccharide biosynthesis glycosyltransferase
VDSAIYLVADKRMFLGAVAAINSLRLVGHHERIYLLDCGLSARQRVYLEREATVVAGESGRTPHLSKHALPLARPADVMLLIDADVIVTRPLVQLLDLVAQGHIVAFADPLSDRFDLRWGKLLGLGEPRRQQYVNSGIVGMPRELGTEILELFRAVAPRVDVTRSMAGCGRPEEPFYFLDQDVLNVILATRIAADRLVALEHALAPHPPFRGVHLRDPATLDCVYPDGAQPLALHHIQRKPWLALLPSSVYSRLLPRLLLAPDLPVRVEPLDVPLRLRTGLLASLARCRAGTVASLRRLRARAHVRRRLAAIGLQRAVD